LFVEVNYLTIIIRSGYPAQPLPNLVYVWRHLRYVQF
jgi:hypothetical protein